jgi:hypothetical protein
MNFTACGMRRSWPNMRYDNGVFVEEMKKITKDLRIFGLKDEI